eukprot:g65433.t1
MIPRRGLSWTERAGWGLPKTHCKNHGVRVVYGLICNAQKLTQWQIRRMRARLKGALVAPCTTKLPRT